MINLKLAPVWATHYEGFWQTVRARNLWFIKLRFGAVLMLLSFTLALQFYFEFDLTPEQLFVLYLVNASLLIINVFLFLLRKYLLKEVRKFSPLHFSLLQISLDVFLLLTLVYFTGTIESPLAFLFVFHMIAASLILPGAVVYTIAGFVVSFFFAMTVLEYFGLITHHAIEGLLPAPLYNNFDFLLITNPAFAFVLVMSAVIANQIARQLYKNEQALLASLEQLKSAEEEKQKYVLGIIHEIKTPVAAIHSILNVVLDRYAGPISEQAALQLNRAKERVDEAVLLVNNILKISKLKLLERLDKEEIELNQLVKTIFEKFIPQASEKNISFLFSQNQKQKIFINADGFLFELAISNLINNAIKYTPPNGAVEVAVKPGEIPTIEICDNGKGIPADQLEKIFTGYFRADNVRKSGAEGVGIGLSTVKQILEKHNCRIEIKSPSEIGDEKNPGTLVIVTIASKGFAA